LILFSIIFNGALKLSLSVLEKINTTSFTNNINVHITSNEDNPKNKNESKKLELSNNFQIISSNKNNIMYIPSKKDNINFKENNLTNINKNTIKNAIEN
jgi:hypothetical protein